MQAARQRSGACRGARSCLGSDVTLLPPLELCSQKVNAFASRNAILFQSGSARIADESLPAIDQLAADLALCPEATVNVEGHTTPTAMRRPIWRSPSLAPKPSSTP